MPLKIYAVGDIMLGEQPLCDTFGVKSVIQKNGSKYLFREVSPLFKDGDIVFGNLECSIMDINSKTGKDSVFFCAEPEVIQGLKNAHFNVLSVANNHIMENGRKTFLHTVKNLKDNDIAPVGVRDEIEILHIKGYRIAFLGYSYIEDHIADVCYNKIYHKDAIIKDIEKVKPVSDLIIISLHWGSEYVPYPSPDQIQIGRDLVDAGADIILGGHPHITQSYEIYKNRPIFYSLGNFIFDHTYIPTTRESFIAEIDVQDSSDLMDINITPVTINAYDYHPHIMNSPHSDAFLMSVGAIRNSFENRSLSDYITYIGDYNLLYNKYKAAVKWNMKVHFVKNLYRYSFSTVCSTVSSYFGKKRRYEA
ncbi:CapA family protein [Methanoculleus sp. FWC-SCC1]|uniref:CapA family protein n=1 Tax=Methanoculleus frigidifontis TaxID=2584085 RepID=A0ABT8MCJ1_9EURY|nr:CapA family protein [Methanoculleus sp. FWC-SCC1]MDN7025662.1 CapA family protein [Methanoculleus sp. FWC-SCC1]